MGDYVFLWKGSVLVSKGRYNKVPQIEWLHTRDIYSFTVRVSRSTKSKFWWGQAPSSGSWHRIFSCLLLPNSGGSWHYLACGCITLFSASVFIWPLFLCLLGSSPLLIRIPMMRFRTHPKSRISSREPEPSAKAIFPSSRSEVPGTC